MYILKKILGPLKKDAATNEEEIEKYIQRIRRSTNYSKQRRDQAEKMFHKIFALGGRTPREAYDISFISNTKGIQSYRTHRTKKALKEKRNDKK